MGAITLISIMAVGYCRMCSCYEIKFTAKNSGGGGVHMFDDLVLCQVPIFLVQTSRYQVDIIRCPKITVFKNLPRGRVQIWLMDYDVSKIPVDL